MNLSQPSLLDPPVPKRHKRVRETSVGAYADGRERFTGRKAHVLRWLAAHWNRWQVSPTSAELAQRTDEKAGIDWTAHVLYVRRGLSDLQTAGCVEAVPHGERACNVTGRICETWRVKQR